MRVDGLDTGVQPFARIEAVDRAAVAGEMRIGNLDDLERGHCRVASQKGTMATGPRFTASRRAPASR